MQSIKKFYLDIRNTIGQKIKVRLLKTHEYFIVVYSRTKEKHFLGIIT